MNIQDITVVICCAGMGTRLGLSATKSNLKIKGKSIIQKQLELFSAFDDVRVVVGYKADRIIDEVNSIRDDVLFAFNYDYLDSGVASSLKKGIIGAKKYTLYLDGDVIINKADLNNFLKTDRECIAITDYKSTDPILCNVINGQVITFYKGESCWSCMALLETVKLNYYSFDNVYEIIEKFLPLDAIKIRSQEINTSDDFERAISLIDKGVI